jgi:transcriptional accessory protein Tex/SPT6
VLNLFFMDLPNAEHVLRLTQELNLKVHQVAATAQLFKEGATVPFIARYRKEATGELDEVQITTIRDRLGARADHEVLHEQVVALLRHGGNVHAKRGRVRLDGRIGRDVGGGAIGAAGAHE